MDVVLRTVMREKMLVMVPTKEVIRACSINNV